MTDSLSADKPIVKVPNPWDEVLRATRESIALAGPQELRADDFGIITVYSYGWLVMRGLRLEAQTDAFGDSATIKGLYQRDWFRALSYRRGSNTPVVTSGAFQLLDPNTAIVPPLVHEDVSAPGHAEQTNEARREGTSPSSRAKSDAPEFFLSDATLDILRQGMEQRQLDGYTSALTAAFEAMANDDEKPFTKALAEIIENMIMTVAGAIRDGRWKGEIGSSSRFSSPMGEEFRARFPLPYDWLPPFMASVFQDLKAALQGGFKLQGKWGRLQYDERYEAMRIAARDAATVHPRAVPLA